MDDSEARMMGNWKGTRVRGSEAKKILNGVEDGEEEAHEAVDLNGEIVNSDSSSSKVNSESSSSKQIVGVNKLRAL